MKVRNWSFLVEPFRLHSFAGVIVISITTCWYCVLYIIRPYRHKASVRYADVVHNILSDFAIDAPSEASVDSFKASLDKALNVFCITLQQNVWLELEMNLGFCISISIVFFSIQPTIVYWCVYRGAALACVRLDLNYDTILVGSVALLVARRTNDRKVVGSRPTKVVCITVLTGNRMGVNCPLWPAATPSSEL